MIRETVWFTLRLHWYQKTANTIDHARVFRTHARPVLWTWAGIFHGKEESICEQTL